MNKFWFYYWENFKKNWNYIKKISNKNKNSKKILIKNKKFSQAKKNFLKNNSAFTLMEIMVSIVILWIISSSVFSIFNTLIIWWKKDKMKIEMNSEIVNAVASVKKYIKQADELKILNSNIHNKNILWNILNWILIKNKTQNINSSLFTLIKPLKTRLSWDFWEKTIWDENFHLWIIDLNLFSDIAKDWNDLYYSDPWNWYIWKKTWSSETKISWFEIGSTNTREKKFLTPTWILVWSWSNANIYFSDTYQNLIFYVPKNNFNNQNVKILAWNFWIHTDKNTWKKTDFVISWFKDWIFWKNTLNHPKWLALYNNHLYIADSWNNVIRILDLINNNLETYIWNWESWISEDWVFPSEFLLNNPSDIDIKTDNNWFWMLLISDTDNNRIVAAWPFTWNNSYYKPFTIAWVWKTEMKNLADWFFNLTDKFVWNNKEIIKLEKNIWYQWFWWDFFLANNAILNHPTWIKFFWTWWFIFSDSWNNLIRKVSVWDFWNWKSLFDNQNRIETIIWNSSEILISSKEDNWSMDFKISTSAPESKNWTWSSKNAFLDNPMWLSFSWSDILFTDLFLTKKRLYWKINSCDWECLNWSWNVNFIREKAFNALNIDKISITNLWDFISKTPLDVMQFIEKNTEIWWQQMISIYLKFINYLKWDKNSIDIRTSVENRKIN